MKNTFLSNRVSYEAQYNETSDEWTYGNKSSYTKVSLNEELIATIVYSICTAIYMDDLNARALANDSEMVLQLSQTSLEACNTIISFVSDASLSVIRNTCSTSSCNLFN